MSSDSGETTVVRTIGRYRAFGELGRGAMGVVYRGFDPVIGRTVALKTLSIDSADANAREFRDRLYREAAAAGSLSHPNIVTIYDIVEDAGLTAIAMELIEGRSLAAIIAERAPLPIDLAVEILDQVCSALDYAGSQGIVHRDIKPANILVTTTGRAKVTDFGVARLALSTMTQAGTVLGSPSYMSPEQVKGLSLDGRSDLFSAAVVFFEMITRERPFAGNDIATTMYRIAHEPPTPPSQFNPAVGPEIAAVLERAFAKGPADRFQTGTDMVAELRAAASLGSTRGSSPALAALAAAPPPMPPIVAPIVDEARAALAPAQGAPPETVPIPVTSAGVPARASSGEHVLAPIPGSGPGTASAAPGPATPGVELPAIPLPAEAGGPAVPGPSAPATPSGRPGVSRGVALAGVAGAIVVVLGIAGGMYLRGGAGTPANEPAAAIAVEPSPQQLAELAGAPTPSTDTAPPPAPHVPPSPEPPATVPSASRRGPGGASGRIPAASQTSAGARAQPPRASATPTPAATGQPTPAQASPVAARPPGRVYQMTEVDVKPEVLTQVAPIYTDDAVKQNVHDVVILQVLVDEKGRPQTIRLLRGSQKAPLLDGSAAAAVRQWTFRPAQKGGQPVPCWFNVGVPFPPAK
jgi:serine/threonine-protein kinase